MTAPGDPAARIRELEAEVERLRGVVARAEIAGQMKHITAEMVRGDQPLEAKEEFIADLRARLSHAEAERDGWRERAAKNREGWKQMLARAEAAETECDALREVARDVRSLPNAEHPPRGACCKGDDCRCTE